MTEYVFRPKRWKNGQRFVSRVYHGRFALARGEKLVSVSLDTPDEQVARKRLRDLVVERQQEREGMIAPSAMRAAAARKLDELVADYAVDLAAREVSPRYRHDTIQRLGRILRETGWQRLAEVRPAEFVQWRASLAGSAKTKLEYQTSLNAFLNWLVRLERLAGNPLAKLDRIDIRGKQVRPSRAYTEAEMARLLEVAEPGRALAYRMLLYTGQRVSEVAALVWGDLHLDEEPAYAQFREGTMKDREKRSVPLKRELARLLRAARPVGAGPAVRVFASFPRGEHLARDLREAGIERTDGLGRVVHFHSFRKTWQTWGVQHGVSQRMAQEILGHADANMTAKVYTDVPRLGVHEEMEKLPWIGDREVMTKEDRAWAGPETGRLDALVEIREALQTLLGRVDALVRARRLGEGAGLSGG